MGICPYSQDKFGSILFSLETSNKSSWQICLCNIENCYNLPREMLQPTPFPG